MPSADKVVSTVAIAVEGEAVTRLRLFKNLSYIYAVSGIVFLHTFFVCPKKKDAYLLTHT
jgi:hypothetical protein